MNWIPLSKGMISLQLILILYVGIFQTHGFVIRNRNVMNVIVKMSGNEDDFIPNKPLDLPSLHPRDAGPMYSTCQSNDGVQKIYPKAIQKSNNNDTSANSDSATNTPSEFGTKEDPPPTFFGLEPKSEELRRRDGSMTDQGVPLFTSSVVLAMTCYFIYIALFTDQL